MGLTRCSSTLALAPSLGRAARRSGLRLQGLRRTFAVPTPKGRAEGHHQACGGCDAAAPTTRRRLPADRACLLGTRRVQGTPCRLLPRPLLPTCRLLSQMPRLASRPVAAPRSYRPPGDRPACHSHPLEGPKEEEGRVQSLAGRHRRHQQPLPPLPLRVPRYPPPAHRRQRLSRCTRAKQTAHPLAAPAPHTLLPWAERHRAESRGRP